MIVDANVLLYAVDAGSPHHERAASWLESALNGPTRIGLPVQTLAAFARIITHPRIYDRPLSASQAGDLVDGWLARRVVWVPPASHTTWSIAAALLRTHHGSANLVPDVVLAASAVEHGVPVVSADSDFARFPEVSWINPLTA